MMPPMSSEGSVLPRLLKGGTPWAVVSKTRMSGSGIVSALRSMFVASSASMVPLALMRAQGWMEGMAALVLPVVLMSNDMASMPHDSAGAGGVGTGVTQL
jgi:hypothetical protein